MTRKHKCEITGCMMERRKKILQGGWRGASRQKGNLMRPERDRPGQNSASISNTNVFTCIEDPQLHATNAVNSLFIFILIQVFSNSLCYGFVWLLRYIHHSILDI